MDMDKYIGRLLDNRYEILEVLGTGGMAVVYKARCHRLNRLVALKILKDEYSQDEEFRRRFHAESHAVAMLSHPNIVAVYDVSTSDDADYIVMELIDGITLKQYMEKKGVLNWKETLHFSIQIAKALDHAHSRGIIHRDIKPHNVMVLKNGSVKVTDFGIARVMSKSNTLTKEALGSVHYISPEQAKGGRVDNRSDVYSLGIVMYEMMAGRPPYDGESPVAVAIQHINGNPQMPSVLNPNIPGGLEQIIMKAMAKEPGRRYNTATAMLHDMDEFRKDPTILFDYHNSSTGMDDATLLQSNLQSSQQQQPQKTAAERAVIKNSGGEPIKPTPTVKQKPEKPSQKRRRREEIVEDDEKGSKIATVAVVLCALVAVVAIGIFLAALLGGEGVTEPQNLVTIPNLLSKPLEEAVTATDYVVEVEVYQYNEDYEKGRIIKQNPAANTAVPRGSTVYVIVSAGPEPTTKIMEDFVNLDVEQAKNFLINTQGVNANLILVREEASSEVEAGRIIRTDPVKNEPIEEGQSIQLWVSTGPSIVTKTMVDFTSDFYTEESAIRWLERNGFDNYTVERVESDKTAGKVISQSIAPGKTVPVNTEIILVVSSGSQSTQQPDDPVTDIPEDYVPKLVDVVLPEDQTEDYVLSVYQDGKLIEERKILVGTVSTQFTLYGKGTMEFTLMIGTSVQWTIEVTFDE